MARRIAAATSLLAFIITTLFLFVAIGFLIAAPPGSRPIPELTMLGVAMIAFLLAGLMDLYVRAQEQAAGQAVVVSLEQRQVELMAEVVDALVAAHRNGKPKVLIPHIEIPEPPHVAETKLPRHRAKP